MAAQAVASHDAASEELGEAWRKAYGRDADPPDAWDHSIKAIEHILKPVVCPSNAKATLGDIVGDLRSRPTSESWRYQARTVTSVLTGWCPCST